MFDLTNVKPVTPQFPEKKQNKSPATSDGQGPKTIQDLQEDFEGVLMSDPASANQIREQNRLKANRESANHIPRYEIDNFGGLRGKYNAQLADEIYAKDKAAGLVPDLENDEFVG